MQSRDDSENSLVKYLSKIVTFLLVLGSAWALFNLISYSLNPPVDAVIELKDPDIIKSRAYIAGAVNNPGVYDLKKSMTVIELINLAGGFTSDADIKKVEQKVNLSQVVKNEDHIVIPRQTAKAKDAGNESGSDEVVVLDNAEKASVKGETSEEVALMININTASTAELDKLPGVGAATAQKIVEGRPYTKIEDIQKIKGIGPVTFSKIKDMISVE